MEKLSDQVERKFVEVFDASDWEVETEDGWVSIISSNKTEEYEVYEIYLENGLTLQCADNHILIDHEYEEVYAKDSVGRLIRTIDGSSKCLSYRKIAEPENMYDLSIDSEDHTYFANGILSHNSTTAAAYFVWYMIFNKKKFISIMANKAEISYEILYRVKEMYESVPIWLQQGVKRWNVKSIGLENGSRILASATTPSAIRGKSVNILFIDEVAHIPKKLWDQFYLSSYPTLSSGDTTQMIFVSTPKGLNHFYEFYINSPGNGFVTSDATWERHPNRDEEWKKVQLGKMTVEQFAQEQECSFVGSSYSLINPGTLTTLKSEEPIEIAESLWIFEGPIKGQNYVITADVSEGLGMDYSGFHVFKLTDLRNGMLEQVASFYDNRTDPITYASTLYRIGMFYNEAPVLVEANDVGRQVVRYLKIDLEYPSVIRTRQEIDPARPSADKTRDYGLRVTKRTKRIGCINFKLFLEKMKFKIRCSRTIEELKHFVRPPEVADKDGTFKAEDGYHDDLVMPLVNLSFIFGTKHFENAFETKSLLEMFKESVSDKADISKALSEIHIPIISPRPNTGGMLSITETFSVKPTSISNLSANERSWFSRG